MDLEQVNAAVTRAADSGALTCQDAHPGGEAGGRALVGLACNGAVAKVRVCELGCL